MPWTQTDPMLERTKFLVAFQEGAYSMTELCERFSISRKTGYKWITRFEKEGFEGLKEKSRAPLNCQHRMPRQVEELLLETRRGHPFWGPRKVLSYLSPRHPELKLPAPSTVGDLFARSGLVERRRRQRKWTHPGGGAMKTEQPNDVWSADFKGHFRTQDGLYCYPLTVADGHSRYLLACQALLSTEQSGVFPVFYGLFKDYGLPRAIRTDNGNPFATQAICGLSKLNVWWIKLGIGHQRIEPGQPQQNGRHERMHRTLKAETTRPPEQNLVRQQHRFDSFRHEFNQERPHEAIQMKTPGSLYASSQRPMPDRVPEPQYAQHMEVRLVSNAGTFRIKKRQLFLSQALVKEYIALEEIDDGLWSLYFYDVLLARLDERDYKLRP